MPERNEVKVMFYITFRRVNANGSLYVEPTSGGLSQCPQNMISDNTQIVFHIKSADLLVDKVCSFAAVQEGEGKATVYFSLPVGKQYSFYYNWQPPNSSPCYDNVYFDIETMAKYKVNNNGTLVGGLRIGTIEHHDPYALNSLITKFDYQKDNGESSGILPAIPNWGFYKRAEGKWNCCICSELSIPIFLGYVKFKVRSSNSTQTLGYAFGSNVGYNQVTISKIDGKDQTLGKTVEYFTNPDLRNTKDVFPYSTTQLIEWGSGHKWQEKIFDRTNTLLKLTNYEYRDQINQAINNNNRSIRIASIRIDDCATDNPYPYHRYVATSMYPYSGRSFLDTKTETEYTATGSMTTLTKYEYNDNNYLTKLSVIDSKGENLNEKYFYPSLYTNTAIQKLVTNKVLNIPLAKKVTKTDPLVFRAEREIKAEGIDYTIDNGFARPWRFSENASTNPSVFPAFDPASVKRSTDIITGEITKYDSYGNVVEFKGRDGILSCIIYGYKGTLPVAKIAGAGYTDALTKLSSVTYANLQLITDDNILQSKLNEIRQGYSSNKFVQVSTSTYIPLYGPTSETDVNGRTTYYEYDGFGRLSLVRNNETKIVKKYCYNYIGQQTDCSETKNAPPPCATCIGPLKKCINNLCEDAQPHLSSQFINGIYHCSLYYSWSDGSSTVPTVWTSTQHCIEPL